MKPSVYIETTIVSYLTARPSSDLQLAGTSATTLNWWTESRGSFDLFSSELTIDEASSGDAVAAQERLRVLQTLPTLLITPEAEQVAAALLSQVALPAKARRDALHVGISVVNGIDYLLTWNCRHLANATLQRKIQEVCRNQGFEPPVICTPLELNEVRP